MKNPIGRPKKYAKPGTKCGNGVQLVTRKDQPKQYDRSDPTESSGEVRGGKLLIAIQAQGISFREIQIRIIEKYGEYIPSVKNITEYCRNGLPMSDKTLKRIISVLNESTRHGYRITLTPELTLEDCKEVSYGSTIKKDFTRLRRDKRKTGKEYNLVYDILESRY